jgi:hypothetical protein
VTGSYHSAFKAQPDDVASVPTVRGALSNIKTLVAWAASVALAASGPGHQRHEGVGESL